MACGNVKSGGAWQQIYNRQKHKSYHIVGFDSCVDDATSIETAKLYMLSLSSSQKHPIPSDSYDVFNANMVTPLHTTDNPRLRKIIAAPEYFNLITSVFSIYYAAESEKSFRIFLANISRNLQIGGHFLCSYMNRGAVLKLMGAKDEITRRIPAGSGKGKVQAWSIKHAPNTELFGNTITVTFRNLYDNNTEYLIDLSAPKILDIMAEYGLVPVSHAKFSDNGPNFSKLQKEEKHWLNLHYVAVFKKVEIEHAGLIKYQSLFNGQSPKLAPPRPAKPAEAAKPAKVKTIKAVKAVKVKVKAVKPERPASPESKPAPVIKKKPKDEKPKKPKDEKPKKKKFKLKKMVRPVPIKKTEP